MSKYQEKGKVDSCGDFNASCGLTSSYNDRQFLPSNPFFPYDPNDLNDCNLQERVNKDHVLDCFVNLRRVTELSIANGKLGAIATSPNLHIVQKETRVLWIIYFYRITILMIFHHFRSYRLKISQIMLQTFLRLEFLLYLLLKTHVIPTRKKLLTN